MKKTLFILTILMSTLSMWAEDKCNSYYNSHFDRDFEIRAFTYNDTIESVWVEVGSDNSKRNFIVLCGDKHQQFINILKLAKNQYLQTIELYAKKNSDCSRYLAYGDFPLVDVAWTNDPLDLRGSYLEKIALKLSFPDDGKITASWSPELPDSDNPFDLQRIYFVFDNIDDFDWLINSLEVALNDK
ncbi:MAG: hypothetical protein J6C44_00985 [Muribaculaceae bacterium]|nr:hypothetical protein [Muribaculaceae bacterium]